MFMEGNRSCYQIFFHTDTAQHNIDTIPTQALSDKGFVTVWLVDSRILSETTGEIYTFR